MMNQQLRLILFFLSILLGLSSSWLFAQDFLWTEIAGFGKLQAVEEGQKEIYLVSEGGLFVLPDKQKMDTLLPMGYSEGLMHHGVSKISYLPQRESLFVYYSSGAFDLISKDGVVSNIAIRDNLSLQNRSLSRIVYSNDKLYLAGGFGLSRVNIEPATIEATYFIMQSLRDVACLGKKLYVVDEKGSLLEGNEEYNLQDPSQWKFVNIPTLEGKKLSAIAALGEDLLLLLEEEKQLIRFNPNTKEIRKVEEDIQTLLTTSRGVLAHGKDRLVFYAYSGDVRVYPINGQEIQWASSTQDEETVYVARGEKLLLLKKSGEYAEKQIAYNGPSTNRFFDATLSHGCFYSVGGGRSIDRSWMRGSIAIRNLAGEWCNISREDLPEHLRGQFFDPVSIAVDPQDETHFYVGSWGEGLYEFRNNKFVARHDSSNSPLVSALPQRDDADRYVRVSSLAFDAKGNLWMTQGSTKKNIWMLSKEGKWSSFEFPEIAEVNAFDKFLIMPSGTKWLNMAHRGLSGVHALFVFNDNGTPENRSDDKSYYFTQFPDRTGKNIEAKRYYDMVLDKKGTLWIGSDKGPLIISDLEAPMRVGRTPIATRPVGGVEPNLFYVLDNVPVSSIAPDVVNNKWIGTLGDGIYLLSTDGTEILEHFTQSNSPLISNEIISLLLDEKTGLLYISTEKGLMTYNTGSRSFEKEMKKAIHAYPNPLRPEDPDEITFTGLVAGMEIKILNAGGELVVSAFSPGATYRFVPRSNDGSRLPAGVYMALFYDSASKLSYSIRFAIIQ